MSRVKMLKEVGTATSDSAALTQLSECGGERKGRGGESVVNGLSLCFPAGPLILLLTDTYVLGCANDRFGDSLYNRNAIEQISPI